MAQVAPQVELPRSRCLDAELVTALRIVTSVVFVLRFEVNLGPNLREHVGHIDALHRSQFFDAGGSHLHIFIIFQRLADKPL